MKKIEVTSVRLVRESSRAYNVDSTVIHNSDDAAVIFEAVFEMSTRAQEIAAVLFTNIKNEVIGASMFGMGSVNASLFSVQEVMKRALLHNAVGIFLAHNHPSGEITPSREDWSSTLKIREAGKLLDIPVIDHVIIGNGRYVSLLDMEDAGNEFSTVPAVAAAYARPIVMPEPPKPKKKVVEKVGTKYASIWEPSLF